MFISTGTSVGGNLLSSVDIEEEGAVAAPLSSSLMRLLSFELGELGEVLSLFVPTELIILVRSRDICSLSDQKIEKKKFICTKLRPIPTIGVYNWGILRNLASQPPKT